MGSIWNLISKYGLKVRIFTPQSQLWRKEDGDRFGVVAEQAFGRKGMFYSIPIKVRLVSVAMSGLLEEEEEGLCAYEVFRIKSLEQRNRKSSHRDSADV